MEYLGTNKPVNRIKPVVSVCVVTYQHADFIKECLDSILMQQTAFPFEVIVGEDDSTDGTQDLCKVFAENHPDKVRLFLRSRKDVIYINSQPTGRFNSIENLRAARGLYVALCEGDDYWTDPFKLQKQVDFMESHPDFSLCFHDATLVDAEQNTLQETFCHPRTTGEFPLTEFFNDNRTATCSKVFRTSAIMPLPEANHILAYDWLLSVQAGGCGKIYYFDENWCAYRIHSAGQWQKMTEIEMKEAAYNALSGIDAYFGYEYREFILPSLSKRKLELARSYLSLNQYGSSFSCLFDSLRLRLLAMLESR